MRIISPFKDYYDYISQRFGFDPDIVYTRRQLHLEGDKDIFRPDSFVVDFPHVEQLPTLLSSRVNQVGGTITFAWLFCAGIVHLLVSDSAYSAYDVVTLDKYPELANWVNPTRFRHRSIEDYLGKRIPELDALAKQLNQPVFIINYISRTRNTDKWHLNAHCPVLAQCGMASLVPPTDMYQRIYSYLTNVLRDSPDLKPPIEVSNDVKITQHGFDLQQSFRHRQK